ncbi:hypothetical protein [Oscillatoria sp. FACHB-1406]|nr:hypothetical protein [Oscillatoria sp. FACHB-1406]
MKFHITDALSIPIRRNNLSVSRDRSTTGAAGNLFSNDKTANIP